MTSPLPGQAAFPGPIVFFDGECGFCNASVQFVLNHESSPIMHFASIQGETAKQLLATSPLPPGIGERTIVLYESGQFLIRSRAVLRIMHLMGGRWTHLSRASGFIPTVLSNAAYRLIAPIRRTLPSGNACKLLTPEQQKRFLP